MSAQTVLLDFSIDPSRICDEVARKDLVKIINQGLVSFFPNIKFVYDFQMNDGLVSVFSENNLIFINVRLFVHGIITINIEYYKDDHQLQYFSFDVIILCFFLYIY